MSGTEKLVAIAAAGGDGLRRPRALLPTAAAGADEADAATRLKLMFMTILLLVLAAVVSSHAVATSGSTAVSESLVVMAGTEGLVATVAAGGELVGTGAAGGELVATAAAGGSLEDLTVAIKAVEAGASLARTNDEGRRAQLHAADAHQGDEAVGSEGARSLEARRTVTGETPLHMLAAREAHTPAAAGASSARDEDGDTSLHKTAAVRAVLAAASATQTALNTYTALRQYAALCVSPYLHENAAAAATPPRQQASLPAAAAAATAAPVAVAEPAAAAAANLKASLVRAMRGHPAAPISARRWLAMRARHVAAGSL